MENIICRVWYGWTSIEHADSYEVLLKEKILPGIHRVKGFRGAQLLRKESSLPGEIEFMTITCFDSLESVIEFAGKDMRNAVIPEEAINLLSRFDAFSSHYELKFNNAHLDFLQ